MKKNITMKIILVCIIYLVFILSGYAQSSRSTKTDDFVEILLGTGESNNELSVNGATKDKLAYRGTGYIIRGANYLTNAFGLVYQTKVSFGTRSVKSNSSTNTSTNTGSGTTDVVTTTLTDTSINTTEYEYYIGIRIKY